jgi:hypothetical protein
VALHYHAVLAELTIKERGDEMQSAMDLLKKQKGLNEHFTLVRDRAGTAHLIETVINTR